MVNEVLRIATITSLLIVILHFLKFSNKNKGHWIGIVFTLCVISYLVVDSHIVQDNFSIAFSILLSGAFLLPFFFWLLSKAIFDDHLKFTKSYYLFAALILAINYFAFSVFKNIELLNLQVRPSARNLILLIPKLFSFGFIVLSIYEALKYRTVDLVDERIRFRNLFVFSTASLIGITVIVEIIGLKSVVLESAQKFVIMSMSWYFLFKNMEIKEGFFFTEQPRSIKNPRVEVYSEIVDKINKLLAEQKVYKVEGLTINKLADLIGEQEYKLRRAINGEMGFRNFNDFINKYRVQEACLILQDLNLSKLTIQEISYQLGYNSIGPFNKAFKGQTGQTPTAYRRAH